MNPTKNIQNHFRAKLASQAQVPISTITWTAWRSTKAGWSGKVKIDAPGCKVTSFTFTGSTKRWRFAKVH